MNVNIQGTVWSENIEMFSKSNQATRWKLRKSLR